ncbi:MAG: ABC transporter ATP-binding protein [Dehalococcoidales bacterium]
MAMPGKDMANPPEVILETRTLSKWFGGVRAVDKCSLTVRRGTITGLIGPNGAGKTTLFNLVSGIYHPNEGNIFFDGKRIDRLPPHGVFRMGISRTFQITRELASMTLLENLMLTPQGQQGETFWYTIFKPWAVIRQERKLKEKALGILDWINLGHLKDEPAGHLSAGQKKLLGLATMMMTSPRLVLLDEPGAGVNPTLLKQIVETIQRMVAEQGVTIFLIEHDMDLVMGICDPIIVMDNGTKLAEGTPEEIRSDEKVLSAYLGG